MYPVCEPVPNQRKGCGFHTQTLPIVRFFLWRDLLAYACALELRANADSQEHNAYG
jgi:hypothetical protein